RREWKRRYGWAPPREKQKRSTGIDAAYIRRVIQQINFATAGLRSDGKPHGGKRGRPKKGSQDNSVYASHQHIPGDSTSPEPNTRQRIRAAGLHQSPFLISGESSACRLASGNPEQTT